MSTGSSPHLTDWQSHNTQFTECHNATHPFYPPKVVIHYYRPWSLQHSTIKPHQTVAQGLWYIINLQKLRLQAGQYPPHTNSSVALDKHWLAFQHSESLKLSAASTKSICHVSGLAMGKVKVLAIVNWAGQDHWTLMLGHPHANSSLTISGRQDKRKRRLDIPHEAPGTSKLNQPINALAQTSANYLDMGANTGGPTGENASSIRGLGELGGGRGRPMTATEPSGGFFQNAQGFVMRDTTMVEN
ncbi:hypothetical protein P691DRAFT_789959, partial [Macrolepiota fuliginosa MF-IS2]